MLHMYIRMTVNSILNFIIIYSNREIRGIVNMLSNYCRSLKSRIIDLYYLHCDQAVFIGQNLHYVFQ